MNILVCFLISVHQLLAQCFTSFIFIHLNNRHHLNLPTFICGPATRHTISFNLTITLLTGEQSWKRWDLALNREEMQHSVNFRPLCKITERCFLHKMTNSCFLKLKNYHFTSRASVTERRRVKGKYVCAGKCDVSSDSDANVLVLYFLFFFPFPLKTSRLWVLETSTLGLLYTHMPNDMNVQLLHPADFWLITNHYLFKNPSIHYKYGGAVTQLQIFASSNNLFNNNSAIISLQ